MAEQKDGGVWVFAEQAEGRAARVALELASKGRELADRLAAGLSAVVLGPGAEACASPLFACGADHVYVADDPCLAGYRAEACIPILQRLAEAHRPEVLLFGATMVGLDLAPTLAARLGAGLAAHCIDLDVNEAGQLAMLVPAFGQSCVATIVCPERYPQMATVRPGTFLVEAQEGRVGQLVRVPPLPDVARLRTVLLEQGVAPSQPAGRLEEARVVVAGGAGIGSAEGWRLLEQLADALGGAVAASRPAADAGWAAPEQVVGHSGMSIRPRLYVGVGISGDMLHMVGIKDAQVVVAINNDPHAPIFQQADLGIVGDYRKVLPLLIEALRC